MEILAGPADFNVTMVSALQISPLVLENGAAD